MGFIIGVVLIVILIPILWMANSVAKNMGFSGLGGYINGIISYRINGGDITRSTEEKLEGGTYYQTCADRTKKVMIVHFVSLIVFFGLSFLTLYSLIPVTIISYLLITAFRYKKLMERTARRMRRNSL